VSLTAGGDNAESGGEGIPMRAGLSAASGVRIKQVVDGVTRRLLCSSAIAFAASDVAIDHTGAAYVSADVFDGWMGQSDAFLMKFAPPQPCADITGDGTVGADDLVAVILAWGACPTPPLACEADLNCTSAIDADDLIAVILDWGACE
jgi:hypothetical protein